MKKLFLVMALALGFALPQVGEAQLSQAGNAVSQPVQEVQGVTGNYDYQNNRDGYQGNYRDGYQGGAYQGNYGTGYQYQGGHGGFEGAAHADHIDPNQEYTVGDVQDNGCGECYCLCCKYEPCYYNTTRCVSEPVCCKKKCCHYVPRYYEKCCVKYVPQNYTQTCCKYEPEYYYVDETKYVQKKVCDRHCKYVPKYYYKRVASPAPCCPAPCAPAPVCCP
jgi:hypothetical protein